MARKKRRHDLVDWLGACISVRTRYYTNINPKVHIQYKYRIALARDGAPVNRIIEISKNVKRAIDRGVEGLGSSGISPCIPCNKFRPIYAITPCGVKHKETRKH